MSKPSELLERLINIIEVSDKLDSGKAIKPICDLMRQTGTCSNHDRVTAWDCDNCPLGPKAPEELVPLVNQLKVMELVDGD